MSAEEPAPPVHPATFSDPRQIRRLVRCDVCAARIANNTEDRLTHRNWHEAIRGLVSVVTRHEHIIDIFNLDEDDD